MRMRITLGYITIKLFSCREENTLKTMKLLLFLAAVIAAATAVSVKLAPLHGMDDKTLIPRSYFVIFNKDVTEETIRSHHATVAHHMQRFGAEKNFVKYKYTIIKGYSAMLDEELRDTIRTMPEVQFVETNKEVHAYDCDPRSAANPSWGLRRTEVRLREAQPPPYSEEDNCNGEGVYAYVIDTGIDLSHPNFEGRAEFGEDFVNDGLTGDPNGHGTHVAGTIMSNTYGLAAKARAVAVRVLNSFGSGTFEAVIQGVDYVTNNKKDKSIINMSLGGGATEALDLAVENAREQGVHVVVAAGNSFGDACSYSPARAGVTSVGAIDVSDFMASFSNDGRCVDIFGPGVDIIAEAPGGGTASLSGTSMASPHVAGIIAKYLTSGSCRDSDNEDNINPEDMEEYLETMGTNGIIDGIRNVLETPNLLVYKPCGEAPFSNK